VDNKTIATYFSLFNEIGIIGQLSRALIDARLPHGLSGAHFGVLNHLIRVKDGQTPRALARAFQVPKTTMTHTLSGLVKHDLVRFGLNPRDGRSKTVWLTHKGRQLRAQAIADLAPEMGKLLAPLPAARIEALVADLAQIRTMMDDSRDAER
jgi:DNA-binding MarR family transcriptional regulator